MFNAEKELLKLIAESPINDYLSNEMTTELARWLLQNKVVILPCEIKSTIYRLDRKGNINTRSVKRFEITDSLNLNVILDNRDVFSVYDKNTFFNLSDIQKAVNANKMKWQQYF